MKRSLIFSRLQYLFITFFKSLNNIYVVITIFIIIILIIGRIKIVQNSNFILITALCNEVNDSICSKSSCL